MKAKKISAIVITILFIVVVILSGVWLFTLKKVNVNFAVSENADTSSIQKTLDSLIGNNLIFMDEQEVYSLMKDEYYMEVCSVEKHYPNVLSVSIKERREVYYFSYGDNTYAMTENGFLLNRFDNVQSSGALENNARDKIILELNGVEILSLNLGEIIKTDKDELLDTLFEMAKLMDLTDCIKSITLTCATEITDVLFETYTGVKIRIEKIFEYSNEKTSLALEAYDALITDYQKTYGELQVFKMDNGKLRVTHDQEFITESKEPVV